MKEFVVVEWDRAKRAIDKAQIIINAIAAAFPDLIP